MAAQEKALHIDIPVKLAEVKNVFSIASLSFEGDLPGSIFHLQLIVNDIANWKAKYQVVVVFHTNAGHPTLHDQAYNHDRNIATGNPYKKLITDLMERGVQVELCGATAKESYFADIPELMPAPELLRLASQILDSKLRAFDPSSFRDRYEEALMAHLKAKQAGLPPQPKQSWAVPRRAINLMEALRRSIGADQKAEASRRAPPARKRA